MPCGTGGNLAAIVLRRQWRRGRARVLGAAPAAVRERRDEAISPAWDRRDEAGVAVVVLELDPEAADVAVDDVALGDEVRAPDRVQDLLARHDLTAPAREEVQEALLDPAQVDDRVAGPHLPVDDVDLHLAEGDRGDDRPIGPRRPAADDDRPGQQLLR